jgi:hypothetical protein
VENLAGGLSCTVVIVFYCIYVLPAHAIPCSPRFSVQGSEACLDGAPGDDTLGEGDDKAFDLNAGNYFGFNNWSFLQLQGPASEETVVDVGLSLAFINPAVGSWSIFEFAWEDYDNLVVILKSDTTGEDTIFWSSYLLQDAAASGMWLSGRPLSSFSVFGRVSIPIPEASTWSMVAAGLVALMWAGNIRRQRMFPVN